MLLQVIIVNSKTICFVIVGNKTRNENIIVAVKVIVIGHLFSFANFHRRTVTHVHTSPGSLEPVKMSPAIRNNSNDRD